jgi:ferrous iron transport protein B
MENEKDRRMTIMLVPFMSCSARLPVYGLLTAAFFPKHAGLVIFSLYVLGLLCAIVSGVLLRKTMFRGEPAAFVLELPPYRMPTARNCLMHVWERVRGFLVKAGTLILAMSIVLWFLESFGLSGGLHMVDDPAQSILGVIGTVISPVFAPLGFGSWQAAVAILTGLIAKEAVVSSLCLLYGFSTLDAGSAIAAALSSTFQTPVAAYAFLVFVLLYVPCIAAVSTLYKEMNSLKWTARSILWQICAAWLVSFLVYQIGSLFF